MKRKFFIIKKYYQKTFLEKEKNIALVGCGKISKKHFLSFFRLKKFLKLKAICDIDKEKIIKTKKLLSDLYSGTPEEIKDLEAFEDYLHLLKEIKHGNLKIDLIVICTPNGLHASQCMMAGKLGIDVCTEKPLATNLKDGLLLLDFFKSNKAKLFVVLQQRLNPYIRLLKNQIDKGRFGKIALISSNVFWHRDQDYYDEAKWRGTKLFDGGILLNQACHFLDLISFLPNEKIKKVSSFVRILEREIEAENNAVLNLKYENGVLGNLALTMLTYPRNLESSISVLGTLGSVKIGGTALNKIIIWKFSDKYDDEKIIQDANHEIDSFVELSHFYFYEELIEIINDKKQNLMSVNQGLLSLKLAIRAYQSSTKNNYIELS